MNLVNAQELNSINYSKCSTIIFCDSIQVLEYAYQNKLPRSAKIKTSYPIVLNFKNANIENIKARWTSSQTGKFQSAIYQLYKDVLNTVFSVDDADLEFAFTVSQCQYKFQKTYWRDNVIVEK